MANSFTSSGPQDIPPNRTLSIEVPDVSALLRVGGEITSVRNDPRQWRLALLAGLNHLLSASISAAFILKYPSEDAPPVIVSHFDAGFRSEPHRQAFLDEFNTAGFRDPFSAALLNQFAEKFPGQRTFSAARADLVDDDAWAASSHVKEYRAYTDLGDCLMSVHRSAERSYVMVIMACKLQKDAARFTPRDRIVLNTLHASLDWIYRAEESAQRVNWASALSPRLRQTLDCLLAGDTERQVSRKMEISVHTVHDYVKMLYTHFGVSSRSELIARCMRDNAQSSQTNFPRS